KRVGQAWRVTRIRTILDLILDPILDLILDRAGQVGRVGRVGRCRATLSGSPTGLVGGPLRKRSIHLCALCVLCGCLSVAAQQTQPLPKPSFQAGVEVTSLDVTVVDDRGKPFANLTPDDFVVRIDGAQRRVVSAEWIPLSAPEPAAAAPPAPVGHSIALVEAQMIDKGDRSTLESVQVRECQTSGNSPGAQEMCRGQVEIEAHMVAQDANRDADQTIQTLRDLFAGLRLIDAPKTLILISEGFVMSDESMIIDLGRM